MDFSGTETDFLELKCIFGNWNAFLETEMEFSVTEIEYLVTKMEFLVTEMEFLVTETEFMVNEMDFSGTETYIVGFWNLRFRIAN